MAIYSNCEVILVNSCWSDVCAAIICKERIIQFLLLENSANSLVLRRCLMFRRDDGDREQRSWCCLWCCVACVTWDEPVRFLNSACLWSYKLCTWDRGIGKRTLAIWFWKNEQWNQSHLQCQRSSIAWSKPLPQFGANYITVCFSDMSHSIAIVAAYRSFFLTA